MFFESEAVKKLNGFFEMYVPVVGPVKTVGGEIVRAASRIGYRWFNDGDMLGVGYGNETCNPAGRFLMKRCSKEVEDAVGSIWGCESELVYEAGFGVMVELVVKYLEENPEAAAKNVANMDPQALMTQLGVVQ